MRYGGCSRRWRTVLIRLRRGCRAYEEEGHRLSSALDLDGPARGKRVPIMQPLPHGFGHLDLAGDSVTLHVARHGDRVAP